MKELTIEQKVKAYDEALERARIACKDEDKHLQATLKRIFPELKESGDERIRNAIYNALKYLERELSWDMLYNRVDILDAYAWLEKQGENPADKVEPKFNVGAWITNGDYTWKIVEVKPLDYILQSQDGNIVDDTISHVDEQFHSFTIKDAKEGDVLVYNNGAVEIIMLFKSSVVERLASYTHFHIFNNDLRINSSCDCGNGAHPATKAQRELLFQKMKEAGYEWDAEKKELKKIEQKPIDKVEPIFEVGDTMRTLQEVSNGITSGLPVVVSIDNEYYRCNNETIAIKDQNNYEYPPINKKPTAWSEEDERLYRGLMGLIYSTPYCNSRKKFSDWLKSLKDRVIPLYL